MTALLIFGVIAVICSSVTAVYATVTSRKSVSDAFRALERIESRNEKQLSAVLDRLMTIRWEDYAAIQASQDDEEGGFIPPEEQGDGEVQQDVPKWAALRSALHLTPEENELLAEDFPDEMGVNQ